jgi:hypothetical protein
MSSGKKTFNTIICSSSLPMGEPGCNEPGVLLLMITDVGVALRNQGHYDTSWPNVNGASEVEPLMEDCQGDLPTGNSSELDLGTCEVWTP